MSCTCKIAVHPGHDDGRHFRGNLLQGRCVGQGTNSLSPSVVLGPRIACVATNPDEVGIETVASIDKDGVREDSPVPHHAVLLG